MLNKLFHRPKKQSTPIKKLFLALSICFTLLSNEQACQAQYFGLGSGLGYWGIGSSVLYPLSYLFYSGSSYASPLYALGALGNGFANNAVYNAYRNPYNYLGNYSYNNNYSANTYPFNAGGNTNYPFNYSNYYSNQNQAPVWNYSPNQTPALPQQSNDPNDIFNAKSPATSNDSTPSIAPDRRTLSQANGMPFSFVPDTKALAGFFQTVNTRYKGNLLHALNQTDMHSWAESLSLIPPGQKLPKTINQARKNQITNIVRDPSLEPQRKLDILRLLLQ